MTTTMPTTAPTTMTTTALEIPFTYVSRGREIPYRFAIAHRRAWRRIAAPGDWWSGAERVAIAAETRAAAECRRSHRRPPDFALVSAAEAAPCPRLRPRP